MNTSDATPESTQAQPTFHEGERAVQQRLGVREQLAQIGPRVIRDFMPEQHRAFFHQLPFLIVGSVDARGQPWASVIADPPGFVTSPDPRQLVVRARLLTADPLAENLAPGAPIGLLGIEPQTRRRNRMNGIVADLDDEGFSVRLSQSFGNCPKYIQAREPVYLQADAPTAHAVHRATVLDAAARRMIQRADTFFIATSYPQDSSNGASAQGVDVSHRGGNPGFVRVDGNQLTVPDFVGNFFFNTLGNLQVHPRAGLLFIDFESGDLLYLAVDAEIIWEGAEVDAFAGAERLLRFRVRQLRRVEASLPLRWGPAQRSPFLAPTGSWIGL